MKYLIEWFLNLFIRKKASIVKQNAIFERQNAIIELGKIKAKNEKYLSKYSGRKKYVKTGSNC